MDKLVTANRAYLDTLISKRDGETKFGECVHTIEGKDWINEIKQSKAKFVLLGIPEDIGVRANYGVGGTHTLWPAALRSILNVQETKTQRGECLLVLGAFDFNSEMERSKDMGVEDLRALVEEIDAAVFPVIQHIVSAGKVPVVIGGGHNNAFPILKGASEAKNAGLNCINLDAHSDFREMEGRHSGNGFRYAHREGFLNKYEVIGLHENYNAQNILDELNDDPDLHFSFYEDIFIRERLSFYEAVRNAIDRVAGKPTGIELDLDCIENILSSAITPCGVSAVHARQYITWCAKALSPTYLHLTEGATQLNNGLSSTLPPKLVAYLVLDFIKAYRTKN